MERHEIPEGAGTEFWTVLSDVGSPIVTNGRHGKHRVFAACEDMTEAEHLIEQLQAYALVREKSETAIKTATLQHSRIMYIERKAGNLTGDARIGLVTYSKLRRTLYYRGQAFQSLRGRGFKSNYYDVETGEDYWISGCKRDGSDRLYGERIPVEIDENIRAEYWTQIRGQGSNTNRRYSNM